MSSRDPFDEFDERRDPFRETAGPGQWIPFVVAGATVVVAAVVYVAFGPGQIWFAGPNDADEFVDGAGVRGGVDEQKAEELRRAFAEGDPDRLPGVPALFDRLREAADVENADPAFRALVDFDRLVAEMRTLPSERGRSDFFWDSLKGQLRQSIYLPAAFDELRVVHVSPQPGGTAVVYTVSWELGSDVVQEVRWWIVSEGPGRGWRFYDWEVVQRNVRQSLLEALHQRSSQSEYDAFDRLIQHMNDAYASEDWEDFQLEMEIGRRVVPDTMPELQNLLWFDLADMYREYGDHENVLETLAEISEQDEVPGAHLLRAHALQQLERPDEALAAVHAYARHVPGGPNVDRLTGDVLFALERREEALPYLGRAFLFAPQHAHRLNQYLQAVPFGEEHRVVELIRPLENAADAAFEIRVWNDRAPAVIESLGEFLLEVEPETERGRLRIAEARSLQGYELAAARRYEAVAQATGDPEIAKQALQGRLVALRDAGRIDEAYDTADDKVAAFATLAEFDTEDGSVLDDDELGSLVTRHLAAHPNDPRGWLVKAWLANGGGDHVAAVTAAKTGLRHVVADEEDDDWTDQELEEVLLDARLGSGEWRAAYAEFDDPAVGFVTVARSLRWRERYEELRELLALHPRDPDKPVDRLEFEAYLAAHDEKYGQADQLFSRAAVRAVDEEWRRSAFRRERARLRAEGHLPWTDYENLGPTDDVVRDLGYAFQTAERWDELKQLLDRHERRSGRTPSWLSMRVAVARHEEDHEAVAAVLLETPLDGWGEPNARWQRVGLLGQLAEAMVRLDRSDEMLRWWDTNVEALPDDAHFPRLQLLVAAGRVDEVARYAEKHMVGDYVWGRLRVHDRTGPILLSPEFARVRNLGAPPTPNFDRHAVLLAKSRPRLGLELVESAAREALGDDCTVAALPSDDDAIDGFLATTPEGAIWIAVRRTPFDEGFEPYSDERPKVVDEFEAHAGRVAVGLVGESRLDSAAVHRVAAGLMESDVELAGVYLQFPNLAVQATDEVRALLANGETKLETFVDAGAVEGWFGEAEDSIDYSEQTRLRTSLRVVRIGLAKPPEDRPGEFRLVLRVGPKDLQETWRLAVESTDDLGFRGRLLDESRFVPTMTPGTMLRPSAWAVHDWELLDADGEVIRNGRSEIDPEADGPRGL